MPTLQDAFDHEDSQLAAWGGQETLRLDLLMDYSEAMLAKSPEIQGVAAVRWSVLSDELSNATAVREMKIILVASLYAKALTLDQQRSELFQRVGDSLRRCFASKDLSSFSIAPWYLQGRTIGGSFQNIVWPWKMASWRDVEARRPQAFVKVGFTSKNMVRAHSASLLHGPAAPYAPGGMWLRYRPDAEVTLILVPAAALIAISTVYHETSEGQGFLLSLLHYINQYYQTADRIVRGTDTLAVNAALSVILDPSKGDIASYRRRDDKIHRQNQPASGTGQSSELSVDWTPVEKRLADGIGRLASWFRRR
ncbi:MAG: hypothetical protein AUF76_03020 [Acidobacteria bacterium 13_1_20CM_2_65_9]|nr:MAG: hypothetical protein AUF76_03020 [Acidobacteria bacterium 13_1_20CM_2_65_9]